MALNIDHLRRTADTLEQAVIHLREVESEKDTLYDLFRNAAIKSFELSLETTGKLLRKALKLYGGSPREVDGLVFNDLFRHAGKHGLLNQAAVERWLVYRANRNTTAHDYSEGFANETLKLLPGYLQDVRVLANALRELFDAQARN
ncbi:MAG: nucleotidyltransferase substrate binding protein [Azoarcus sp.]|jgi:nucleotidyltransferase substrate binding protein (TIGR01987 family)|nr:nucleotidyltransferase substrate binding protein [Azoarcus sp.]